MRGIEDRARAIAARHKLEVVRDFEPERDHDALGRITLLCRDSDGHEVVLSVGECRSIWASLLDNRTSVVEFDGRTSIVTPKAWHGYHAGEFTESHPDDPPYEIEEYLAGARFADQWPRQGIPFPDDLCAELRRVVAAIARILAQVPLPQRHIHDVTDWTARCVKRIAGAGFPAIARSPRLISKLAALRHDAFEVVHGHFALTHLIAMPNGRVGLIDLAHLRWAPRHYDLAFLCWAAWFHTELRTLQDSSGALGWMEEFAEDCGGWVHAQRAHELRRFRRVLCERVLGALADLRQDVEHAKRMIRDDAQRRAALTRFLEELIQLLVTR